MRFRVSGLGCRVSEDWCKLVAACDKRLGIKVLAQQAFLPIAIIIDINMLRAGLLLSKGLGFGFPVEIYIPQKILGPSFDLRRGRFLNKVKGLSGSLGSRGQKKEGTTVS